MSPDNGSLRQGIFVAVVGPSGAGKDTLIGCARQKFRDRSDILFVRRVVTRTADRDAEDHDTLSKADFAIAVAEGRFAVQWAAHGLHYGIPSFAVRHVEAGGLAVANCSRSALGVIRERFPAVAVVHVTAPPDVLASRIAARGRETRAETAGRIEREIVDFSGDGNVIEIDNGGRLDEASRAFVAAIDRFLSNRRQSHISLNGNG